MPFADTFTLRAFGPKSDLQFVYGFFLSSSAGAVMTGLPSTAAEAALGLQTASGLQVASGGFTMTALGSGLYRLFHKGCRFRALNFQCLIPTIATVADNRQIAMKTPVAGTDDPAQGRIDFAAILAAGTASNFANGTIVQVTGVMGF